MTSRAPARRRTLALGPLLAAWIAVPSAAQEPGWFRDVSLELGLDFVHDAALEGAYAMPESLGSGVALFDYDSDGDLDVYLLQGAYRDPRRRAATPLVNRLFRQDAGRFVDVTAESGLGDPGYAMGVAIGDYDGDGDLDVYVTNYGPDALYANQGDGRFRDVSATAGIANSAWGTSALFLDYDSDGRLDLFVANYVRWIPSIDCFDRAGRLDFCGPRGFQGQPDALFQNLGGGRFRDVSASSGLAAAPSKGLGVVSADFDADGRPDLFVANDGAPNQLWLNRGGGRFEEQALPLGLAVDGLGQAGAGMGIASGDIDADADLDYYVTQFVGEHNVLYRNLGESGFADDTALTGLTRTDRSLTGFGTGFFDYDADGDLDLAVANGRVVRGPRLTTSRPPGFWDDYAEPNLLFENDGSGGFRDVSQRAGDFTQLVENSRGLAFGDLDGDGDVDLLVSNEGGRARLLRNDHPAQGHWLRVKPVWRAPGGIALGSEVRVRVGERVLLRRVDPGYSYASSSDPRAHFGLGAAQRVDAIEVLWPDGRRERFEGSAVDRERVVEWGRGEPR